ncbi:class I SAM-dependent methyltransferase [Caulobacter sp. KR2-114]|uniref:class I SAM-dependent methyltransferase n=1 Tax=Caulobacter sp. KR2-114 TaxID=3400912 RepID=UPI003C075EAD
MDWTSGYRADIDYTYGYYRELAPGLIDFALLMSGYEPPQRSSSMNYLELGYGQGVSANIQAAAGVGDFWGADFNPVHANHAQSLARISGAPAHFSDESFADMLARDDMPPMDYIVLHGIWSWVSDENRKVIVDTIRKRLKVGGAVYFSYNTLPGWTTAMPLRHIMSLHSEAMGSDAQGMASRIDGAIAFGNKLSDVNARYFQHNPLAKGRLDAIAGQNRNYLAHEYFNETWTPMYFSEVNDWLSEAKLSYATASSLLEQLDGFNFTTPQRDLMNTLPAGVLRETVRDYMLNTQFRRDLYTRGARRLTPLERAERLNDVRLVLCAPSSSFPFEVDANIGKVGLRRDIYEAVIEALEADKGAPKRIGDLLEHPKLTPIGGASVLEALAVLVGAGHAHPALSDADAAAVAPRCKKLNAHFIERARIGNDIQVLASPVIGAGVNIGRFEQMFLGARAKGLKTPTEWAKDAWDLMAKQNQLIVKNNEVLRTAESNLEELDAQAKALAEERLPLLRRLKVVD